MSLELARRFAPSSRLISVLRSFGPGSVYCGQYGSFKEGAHVAVFSSAGATVHSSQIGRFLALGLEDPTRREFCVVAVPPGVTTSDFGVTVRSEWQDPVDLARLEIMPWEVTQAECTEAGRFSRKRDLGWIRNRRHNAEANSCTFVRCISDDTTHYVNTIENPTDYARWEYVLPLDYKAQLGAIGFVQFCVYQPGPIVTKQGEHGRRLILSLLASHDDVLHVAPTGAVSRGRIAKAKTLRDIGVRRLPVGTALRGTIYSFRRRLSSFGTLVGARLKRGVSS